MASLDGKIVLDVEVDTDKLRAQIDEAVADMLRNPGPKTLEAIREVFGKYERS